MGTMLFGHISIGLAARSITSKVSLWVLLVSVEALDILASIFGMVGIEDIGGVTSWVPWSHGLFMAAVWSAGAMGITYIVYRDRRAGLVVGSLVLSHWLLDYISWTAPLPLLFDNTYMVHGLGLSTSVILEVIVEVGALIGGIVTYVIVSKKHPVVGGNLQLVNEQVRTNRNYGIISWSVAAGSLIGLGLWSTSTTLSTLFILGLLYGIFCGIEALGRSRAAKRNQDAMKT